MVDHRALIAPGIASRVRVGIPLWGARRIAVERKRIVGAAGDRLSEASGRRALEVDFWAPSGQDEGTGVRDELSDLWRTEPAQRRVLLAVRDQPDGAAGRGAR